MFSHQVIGSNDMTGSKKFYDAVFGAIGGGPGEVDPKGRLVYAHNGGRFLITTPINGQPATPANGGTIGFVMESPSQADAWHAAGVANGGTSCEDPPGIRTMPNGKQLYLS